MRHFRTAFTLLELLVVISIIAILVSMLMGAVKMVRQSVSTAVCQSNQRQLGVAFITYAHDQRGRMPSGSWNDLLKPYFDQSGGDVSVVGEISQGRRLTTCTAAMGASYGYTGVYYNSIDNDSTPSLAYLQYPFAWVWWMWKQVPILLVRVNNPATKIVLSEREGVWGQNILNDRGARRMHRQGGNFLAADGHVQTVQMPWVEMFALSAAGPGMPDTFKSDPQWRPYNPGISQFMR